MLELELAESPDFSGFFSAGWESGFTPRRPERAVRRSSGRRDTGSSFSYFRVSRGVVFSLIGFTLAERRLDPAGDRTDLGGQLGGQRYQV